MSKVSSSSSSTTTTTTTTTKTTIATTSILGLGILSHFPSNALRVNSTLSELNHVLTPVHHLVYIHCKGICWRVSLSPGSWCGESPAALLGIDISYERGLAGARHAGRFGRCHYIECFSMVSKLPMGHNHFHTSEHGGNLTWTCIFFLLWPFSLWGCPHNPSVCKPTTFSKNIILNFTVSWALYSSVAFEHLKRW